MDRLTETKIVLIMRETRLDELKARYNTEEQARFYVQQSGDDFSLYEEEDRVYKNALSRAQGILGRMGRLQLVHRTFLPNFIFGPEDIAVAVGQDGLVANTLKYLNGQPLVGVNPDPRRYDGRLLPFSVPDLATIMPEVLNRARPIHPVTMAKATVNNGQVLYAVNDLFIGPKTHGSARYTIHHEGQSEYQSSSGLIVSTGLGSTGWFSSLIAGARGIAQALSRESEKSNRQGTPSLPAIHFAWESDFLYFTVREPFPSRTTATSLVFGKVSADARLGLDSHMSEHGVIFSDGMESDFLEFNSGAKVEIGPAEKQGLLVS